jgi:hypothetical protein
MSSRIDGLHARLRKGADRAKQALGNLTDEDWGEVLYAGPPAWTVRDLVAHLLSAEDGLRRVGQNVAAGGAGAPPGPKYDAINASEQRRLAGIPVTRLVSDLVASREATIAWVATLSESDLDKTGRHPALGEITLETHIQAMYGHALMHLRDLRRAKRRA